MGVRNCLVFLTFPYPLPILKNCAIFIGCNFESHGSKVEEPKQQGRVIFKNKRNHTKKKWPWKKGSELWKPGELQNALKVIITWRTTTALKPTYKLLVGGLGCPKKTKEIQDPTKRKYKNQKKKHQTFSHYRHMWRWWCQLLLHWTWAVRKLPYDILSKDSK